MVGAGVTLHEAIVAADALAKEGVNIRVVDPFTLKPIDKDLLIKSAKATGGRLLTVEDHYPEGRRDGGLPPVVGVVARGCGWFYHPNGCCHWFSRLCLAGGLGEAVASAVGEESGITVKIMAVREVPRSGKGAELLKLFGIDSTAIMATVKKMIA